MLNNGKRIWGPQCKHNLRSYKTLQVCHCRELSSDINDHKPRNIHLYISLIESDCGPWSLLTGVPLYASDRYMNFLFFFLKKSKVWLTMDVDEILRESVCGCMCMWTGSYLIISSGRFSDVLLWEEVLDFSTLIDVLCWWSSFSSVTMTLRLSAWDVGSGTILQMLTGTAHPCCFSLWSPPYRRVSRRMSWKYSREVLPFIFLSLWKWWLYTKMSVNAKYLMQNLLN